MLASATERLLCHFVCDGLLVISHSFDSVNNKSVGIKNDTAAFENLLDSSF